MSVEVRAFSCEIRAEQNEEHGHFLTGRPIVFGAKYDNGLWEETIAKGALDHTDLRDVRFLVNHNTDMTPLARSRNNNANSTMQLSPDDAGMAMRADLDIERNADSLSLYSAADRGDISGMSFMFRVESDKWEDLDSDHPKRTITGISKIFEVSAVTWPAYEQTSLEARSHAKALDSAASVLESAREARRKEQEREDLIQSTLRKLEENKNV